MESIYEALPFDFVISYNHEHSLLATKVFDQLEAKNLQGWIDERYFYAAGQSLEDQLGIAWRKARFIVLLVPRDFRDSVWCQLEYGEGLAAERELPLTQVLVLQAGDGQIPDAVITHPRFSYDSSDGLERLGRYINDRRGCMRATSDVSLAAMRWRVASQKLHSDEGVFPPSVLAQLRVVDTICAWLAAQLAGDRADASDSVRLTLIGDGNAETHSFERGDILRCAFSQAIEVDAFPFQRALFDAVYFGPGHTDRSNRDAIDQVVWDQLVMLTCATNPYFRSQMMEAALEIACTRMFPLVDEDALNHFVGISPDFYSAAFDRNMALQDHIRAIAVADKPLASVVEHLLLKRWRERRPSGSHFTEKLPNAERVQLAAKAFKLMKQRFVDGVRAGAVPRQARLLGNLGPTNVHLSPSQMLERFHLTLQEIFGRAVFGVLRSSTLKQIEDGTSRLSRADFEPLLNAFVSVIPAYVLSLEVAARRRAAGRNTIASIPHSDVIEFMDHVIGPYALLAQAGAHVQAMRKASLSALRFFRNRGTKKAAAVAKIIAADMGHPERYGTPEFKMKLLRA